MKLLTRAEMMQMPKGTIFQEFKPCVLGPIMIFGGPFGADDYIEAELGPSVTSTGSATDYIGYPSGFGRNGMFDKSLNYLVWERQDLENMALWLLNPKSAMDAVNGRGLAKVLVPWDRFPQSGVVT